MFCHHMAPRKYTLDYKLLNEKASRLRVELTPDYALGIIKMQDQARIWVFDAKSKDIGEPVDTYPIGLRAIDPETGCQLFPRQKKSILCSTIGI